MSIDITEDADAPFSGDLTGLTRMVELYLALKTSLSEVEKKAAALREKITRMETLDIPEAAIQCGQSTFTTFSGAKVEIKSDVSVGIPKDREEDAYSWLRDNGFEDLIKSEVKVLFGRGDDNKSRLISSLLHENGIEFATKEGVHAQTLKAWVKEQLAKGTNLPLDLFGVYQWRKAVVKEK